MPIDIESWTGPNLKWASNCVSKINIGSRTCLKLFSDGCKSGLEPLPSVLTGSALSIGPVILVISKSWSRTNGLLMWCYDYTTSIHLEASLGGKHNYKSIHVKRVSASSTSPVPRSFREQLKPLVNKGHQCYALCSGCSSSRNKTVWWCEKIKALPWSVENEMRSQICLRPALPFCGFLSHETNSEAE